MSGSFFPNAQVEGLDLPDPLLPEPFYLHVSDLRQYSYCQRVLYYAYCLPKVRPVTYKMEEGEEQHLEEKEREQHRGLAIYGLKELEPWASKRFDVRVQSDGLRLRGRLDMVIDVVREGEHTCYPVEYKATRQQPGPQYRLQLAAYALLLEEQEGVVAKEGYFFLVPLRRAIAVRLDRSVKEKVRRLVAEMHAVVRGESVPPGCGVAGRCALCEFRRFCNDIF